MRAPRNPVAGRGRGAAVFAGFAGSAARRLLRSPADAHVLPCSRRPPRDDRLGARGGHRERSGGLLPPLGRRAVAHRAGGRRYDGDAVDPHPAWRGCAARELHVRTARSRSHRRGSPRRRVPRNRPAGHGRLRARDHVACTPHGCGRDAGRTRRPRDHDPAASQGDRSDRRSHGRVRRARRARGRSARLRRPRRQRVRRRAQRVGALRFARAREPARARGARRDDHHHDQLDHHDDAVRDVSRHGDRHRRRSLPPRGDGRDRPWDVAGVARRPGIRRPPRATDRSRAHLRPRRRARRGDAATASQGAAPARAVRRAAHARSLDGSGRARGRGSARLALAQGATAGLQTLVSGG